MACEVCWNSYPAGVGHLIYSILNLDAHDDGDVISMVPLRGLIFDPAKPTPCFRDANIHAFELRTKTVSRGLRRRHAIGACSGPVICL